MYSVHIRLPCKVRRTLYTYLYKHVDAAISWQGPSCVLVFSSSCCFGRPPHESVPFLAGGRACRKLHGAVLGLPLAVGPHFLGCPTACTPTARDTTHTARTTRCTALFRLSFFGVLFSGVSPPLPALARNQKRVVVGHVARWRSEERAPDGAKTVPPWRVLSGL